MASVRRKLQEATGGAELQGVGVVLVALLSSVPFATAAGSMVLVAKRSARVGARPVFTHDGRAAEGAAPRLQLHKVSCAEQAMAATTLTPVPQAACSRHHDVPCPALLCSQAAVEL